ncbi:MAG: hypothetical protein OXC63_14815 [Aestuariivita sp.]|nr:hypothetical protein [Aestuariivita sp.]
MFFRTERHQHGRPQKDRYALTRSFIAKAIRDMPTTRDLIDRLSCDPPLPHLMWWERVSALPSESPFSRAYETVVGHLSRD